MAYSNTVSQTIFTTRKILENAIRRCRIPAEQLTPEIVDIANDNLYLILSDFANQGIPLWCIEKQILPFYDGVGSVPLDTSVVDILNGNFRQLQAVEGSNSDTSTARTITFSSETIVSTVGIKWLLGSSPIALERSDDGAVWETVQTETPDVGANEWSWYDLDSVIASTYFRVRATSGVLSFETIYTGNLPTEITLYRMNKDDYTTLPNKAFTSNRVLQYWFDRQIPNPIMHLWPVPNAAAEASQIILWVQRYIMDVGTLTQQIEVPQRWYLTVVTALAAALAREVEGVDPGIIPQLDADAEKALIKAQQEERDNSPMMIAPNISAYTI